jgi:hypothetical protein
MGSENSTSSDATPWLTALPSSSPKESFIDDFTIISSFSKLMK